MTGYNRSGRELDRLRLAFPDLTKASTPRRASSQVTRIASLASNPIVLHLQRQ